jgi:mannose-6-phosphate isomerase-like protein (cupin superfamily)
MARVFGPEELPRLDSTRDGRDRLMLLMGGVPVAAQALQVDRVAYRPGDSAAKHYHRGCDHLFYVLEGEGRAHVEDETRSVSAGDTVLVREEETHWFENAGDGRFSMLEFWAPPPPDETVWVTADQ